MTDSKPGSEFMGKITWIMEVADPDLQIRGWAGHPDPEMREGGIGDSVSKKCFFRPSGLSVWSKNKGGARPLP